MSKSQLPVPFFNASFELPRQLQNLFMLQYAHNEAMKMVFLPECVFSMSE